jgi:hypothetical protein
LTALDDTIGEAEAAWLSQIRRISRRIRLTGLLTKNPANAGVFLFMAKNGLQQGPAQLAIAMRATPGIS